jgi:hypothetical protein
MPEIARFDGLTVVMYHHDHEPAHVHCYSGGHSILLLRRSSPMHYDVMSAHHVKGTVLYLEFRDGISGEVDLAPALEGPVFHPLKDPGFFARFSVHPEFHTLVWPNGADLAPEWLYDQVRFAAA